jgi:hypothetical protein
MSTSTPAWLADPARRHQYRYWDGIGWTDHVADNGEAGIDPLDAVASVEEGPVESAVREERAIVSYGRRHPEMAWDAHVALPGSATPRIDRGARLLAVLNELGGSGWRLESVRASSIPLWHDYVMGNHGGSESWEYAKVAYGREMSFKPETDGQMIWAAYITTPPDISKNEIRDGVELPQVVSEMAQRGWTYVAGHDASGIDSSDHFFIRAV